jgi:ABC-2 type transport system permease protein
VERRELLGQLITSDIRIKYKGSALGIAWSMVSPALLLATYYVVFSVFLKNGIPDFAIYLFSGLVAWNLFSTAVISATGVIVDRAGLVKKVSFPREILPLANVGASAIYFALQLLVLVLFLVLMGHAPNWGIVWILPVTVVALYFFTAAVAVVMSACTVYLRDVKHFVEVALLPWFFFTPIVYSYENSLSAALHRHHLATLYFLNPLTIAVITFQRIFYGATQVRSTTTHTVLHLLPTWPASTLLELNLALLAVSIVLFLGAEAVFGRLEPNFESEL